MKQTPEAAPWIPLSFLRSLTYSAQPVLEVVDTEKKDGHSETFRILKDHISVLEKYWKQNKHYPCIINDNQHHKTWGQSS